MDAGCSITFPGAGYSQIPGVRQVVNIANPGAGNNWSFTIPGGYYGRLIAGQATFTTSAVVANRVTGIQINDGNVNLWSVLEPNAITANSTVFMSYTGQPITAQVAGVPAFVAIGIPVAWLEQGYILRSLSQNIDPGDTYTAINLWFEFFDYGYYGQPERVHTPTRDEHERFIEHERRTYGQLPEHAPTGPRG